MRWIAIALLALGLSLNLTACGRDQPPAATPTMNDLGTVAEAYVKLVLALGEHDTAYVDAYYGPEPWRTAVRAQKQPVAAIQAQADALLAQLVRMAEPAEELLRLRRHYLTRQLQALVAHAQRLQGRKFRFDEEAQALYDVQPPPYAEAQFESTLAELERRLPPGDGDVSARYNAYLERYSIAPAKLQAVMQRAIDAARARTQARLALPAGESFTLALVRNKPWSAYNWYQGGYRSRIEVNTDLPVGAARVLALAVHEGYPGHHVYNALLEQELVRKRGWPEFQVYALYSPQSLIAEGTADYAIELAFPDAARLAFLRDVIFPAAGLDPGEAQSYDEIGQLAKRLNGATIEAARRYRDGRASKAQTLAFLQRYALASPARAEQRIAFFDALGAYIVNYSLGEDLVRQYVERRAATPEQRWAVFRELLSTPRLPSDLHGHVRT